MISAMEVVRAWIWNRLRRSRTPRDASRNPWVVFFRGRRCDEHRDAPGAFRAYLVAAQGGLPVAALFIWLAYRLGDGVLADPIAAHAWAQRATALGWPDVLVRPGESDDSPERPPC